MANGWRTAVGVTLLAAAAQVIAGCAGPPSCVLDAMPPPGPLQVAADPPPTPVRPPVLAPGDRPLAINLPTALKLAEVQPLDIAVASERIEQAAAQLRQAQALWLPTVYLGTDYARHDGQIQDVNGNIVGTSKGALMVGAGPSAVFSLSDAILAPLSARQVLRARESALQASRNDSLLAVAEAYFNVQQARGDLAGAEEVARRTADLVQRIEDLARKAEIIPELEVVRARTQAARSRQAVQAARARWRLASADLARVLRLDAAAVVEPLEPPHLRVTLVALDRPVDDLIRIGLSNRPELASQQALVQATLERLRQERLRPLIPSILIRGSSTPVTGTLAAGVFGGGVNGDLSHFGARSDIDVQVLWELRNLGFGNRALVDQQRAENQVAVLELFRIQDRVAAEVARALAEAQSAAARVSDAEAGLRDAADSANKNVQGLGQTKSAGGNLLVLVIRPQEAVAAVQALAQAYTDYYAAVADFDRAQFRLYHALGDPGQALAGAAEACTPPGADPTPPQ